MGQCRLNQNKITKKILLCLLHGSSRAEQIHSCYQWLRSVCKLFALNQQQPHFHLHENANTSAAGTLTGKLNGSFSGVKHKLSALKPILPIKTTPAALGSHHSCEESFQAIGVHVSSTDSSFFFNQNCQKGLKL